MGSTHMGSEQLGSPPLARRAPVDQPGHVPRCRLTSARAESTQSRTRPEQPPEAHLRSRGEHTARAAACAANNGSPPLARRARHEQHPRARRRRLTSARAESTCPLPCQPGRAAAHLRSRGEHERVFGLSATRAGSPPLARRAPHRARQEQGVLRLTSARAESTAPPSTPGSRTAAHLRSRGEHGSHLRGVGTLNGSPPLARRARRTQRQRPIGRRLTSARAESTRRRSRSWPRPAAHLRSRGEHVRAQRHLHACGGSPPLARRARLPPVLRGLAVRLTSARAESTRPRRGQRVLVPAHLRSRGEHPSRPAMLEGLCVFLTQRAVVVHACQPIVWSAIVSGCW